jgi:transketolase
MDFLKDVLTIAGRTDDLHKKFEAFGYEVRTCDGHNADEIVSVIEGWNDGWRSMDTPQVLVANTVKGYGLICMENVAKFHFRLPTEDELKEGNRYE